MIQLENLEGVRLSKGIKNLSPFEYDTIQIKNRLLDGKYHIQQVGEPVKRATFEILSDYNQVDLINAAESRGEDLKLIADDKYYIGKIGEKLSWDRMTMRYKNESDRHYKASAIFYVNEEGTV